MGGGILFTPYNSVPKENIALIILLLVAASESTHQDSRFDTLNSKIRPLVIILWQEQEEEYNSIRGCDTK